MDLDLDIVAKEVNRGSLDGEKLILFFNWAIKQPMIRKDVHSWNIILKMLEKLKILNLSHSRNLRQTPDFSYILNLEQLIMMDCESLEEVHDSIGLLEKLVLVNLEGCRSIKKLPNSFGKLKSLKTLSFSGCPPFENSGDFAAMIFKIKSLKGLSISDLRPSRIMTRFVPTWLKQLCLMHCNLTDDAIPKELGSLPSLEILEISRSNARNLPNLDGLSNLKELELFDCDMLQSVPDLPTNLQFIFVTKCRQLKRVPDMSRMTDLLAVTLYDCFNLVDVPGWNKLLTKSLEYLLLSQERIIWEIINKRCYNLENTFVVGDDIPEGFTFINKGCSVCVDVPQRVNCKLEGFACCILYSHVDRDHMSLEPPDLFVINHTKRIHVKISYRVRLFTFGNNELWLRLVKNGSRYSVEEPHHLKLDSGDKFSVVFSDESTNAVVKKIGVLLLWEDENASVYGVDFAGGETIREDAITLPIEGDTRIVRECKRRRLS